MTIAAQLFAIFAFGLVMSGVVFLGVLRAREVQVRVSKADETAARRYPRRVA